MNPTRTVVFDLDGTLLDTLEDLHLSVNAALASCGLPPRGLDEVRAFVGNGIVVLMRRAVAGRLDEAGEAAALEAFRRHYAEHCDDHTAPYPGIPALLAELRAAGVRMAVVSNKADFAVQQLVEARFPGTFDAVVGEDEARGVRKKPAPDMVGVALGRMGLDRDATDVTYVGDSEVDVQTARAFGCPCVSCTWGFRSVDELLAAGATTLVDDAGELGRALLAGEK